MLIPLLILIASLALLYFGAEFVLTSAEKIGEYFGLSQLFIGLIIVGFGTSLPELFVSQMAGFKGEHDIALGNIIGSNFANLFLILGVAGLMTTLHLNRGDISKQLVLHIILTAILGGILLFDNYEIWHSLILFVFFGIYLYWTYKDMKKEQSSGHPAMFQGEANYDETLSEFMQAKKEEPKKSIKILDFLKLIIGFCFLFFGGEYLVQSATDLGKILGVSTYILSAIIVAFGTSFPELMTALVAAMKKKNVDLITGNVIGSNVFNVALVFASLSPYQIKLQGMSFTREMSFLFAGGFYLLLVSKFNRNFSWVSGTIFLCCYGVMVYFWAFS